MTTIDTADSNRLLDLSESGQPVKSRVGTAQQACAIANRLVENDQIRAARRVKVQGCVDGNAPNSSDVLRQEGRDGESNLNWRMAKGEIINAWTPYFDLRYQVPVCIDGDLDTGDAALDVELMTGFAKAFHTMVFTEAGHAFGTQLSDLQMIEHGIGTRVWPHAIDWRPETVLACNVFVPDGMKLDFTGGSIVMIHSRMEVSELWRKMEDGIPGWNAPTVKKCIMSALSDNSDTQSETLRWDRWQQQFKNGDLYLSSTQAKVVGINTMFVQEMDGRISMMCVQSGTGAGDCGFLYQQIGMFESWEECVNFYPFDVGSDGTYHSVKGLGTEVFPFANLDNKVKNSIADLITTGMRPMFQSATGAEAQKFQLLRMGGYNIAPPGVSVLQGFQNIAAGIQPALEASQAFSAAFGKNTGSVNRDISAPTVEETAKAAMIRAHERSKLNQGAYNRYYVALDREYRETWRRAVNPAYRKHHPGGAAAVKFQQACAKLCERHNVDKGVLQKVENIRAMRDIGLGSPGIRIEIANAFMDPNFLDRLDPVGQNAVLRAFAATLTSYHAVDAFVPSISTGEIPVEDDSIAALENNALAQGGEVIITPRQDHVIHLKHHVGSMEADAASLEQGADLRAVAASLEAKGIHAMQHMAAISRNPTKKRAAAEYGERLRILAGTRDQLEQQIAEQDEAAAEQPQPGQMDPDMMKVQGNLELKAQKQMGDAELKRQRTEADLLLKAQRQQADIALAANRTQADIRLKDASTASDIQLQRAKTSASSNGSEE